MVLFSRDKGIQPTSVFCIQLYIGPYNLLNTEYFFLENQKIKGETFKVLNIF